MCAETIYTISAIVTKISDKNFFIKGVAKHAYENYSDGIQNILEDENTNKLKFLKITEGFTCDKIILKLILVNSMISKKPLKLEIQGKNIISVEPL
jgi:hypothetical protein